VSHLILAVAGSTERFVVVLGFLTAVLGVLVAVGIGRAVRRQVDALEANTNAIRALSGRVDALEGRS
jgi:hypothetical protein